MEGGSHDVCRQLRWAAYSLLMALAAGNMLGRILAVNAVNTIDLERHRIAQRLAKFQQQLSRQNITGPEAAARLNAERTRLQHALKLQRPFLSGNDRSRWATVRALVDHGTYAIDEVIADPGWDTIDKVQHRDRHGTPRLYSSKPTLLPTLLAGPYWLLQRITGWTLATHPYHVGRTMLVLVNVLPMLVYFWLLAKTVERLGGSDWGRLFVMAAATLGTFLTTFAVVLNNHLIAAVAVMISLHSALVILTTEEEQNTPWRHYIFAGLAAAFAAANELPALAYLALLSVLILWHSPRRAALAYLPGVLLVVAGAFGTNYAAHASWLPPYAHRSETDPDDNWYQYTYQRGDREIKSYWHHPRGIDRGEPSRLTYAFHVLIGHHGIFSLTPVWLLSLGGLLLAFRRRGSPEFYLALGIALLSAICLSFYLLRPLADRNYGGMTSGFRWMFWFAPLWLVAMLPACDAIAQRRALRWVALVLLVLSALSASFPTWNPWVQPWLYAV